MNKKMDSNVELVIDSLYQICRNSKFNLDQSTTLKPDLLKKIEEINDSNAIFPFIPLMFVKNKTISKIATKKINTILATLPLQHLNNIDEQIRRFYFSKHSTEINKYWEHLKPSIVDFKNDCRMESITILKILCCHPNGYIRNQAITKLVDTDFQEAIPFLIIRLNDWVKEIRGLSF